MSQKQKGTIKYIQLYEWIKSMIYEQKLKYDEMLPSENMLCMKFDISRQTVRSALQALEEDGLIQRRRGSGTYVAVDFSLDQAKEKTVGLIMSYRLDYIFPAVFTGIESVLFPNNIGVKVAVTKNDVYTEKLCLQRMLDSNLCGLIVEGTKSTFATPNLNYYNEFLRRKIPILFFHNYYENLSAPKVLMDDYGSSYLLTKQLIENGHRNIAGLFKVDDYQGKERYRGYLDCLFAHNLAFQDDWVKWYSTSDFDQASANFDKTLNQFIKRIPSCTAIVAYNDNVAIRLLDVIESRGMRVPDDISLVSFDDTELSRRSSFKIVSAIHPKIAMGEKVASNMVNMIRYQDWERTDYSFRFEPRISGGNSIRNLFQERARDKDIG
jgi:GntR family transcriptional regulator of arabinose operon